MKKQRAMSNELRVLLFILLISLFGCSSTQKTQGSEEDLGDAYTQMGAMFFVDGKFDIAMEQFQKALKEDIKKYGKRHPKVARDCFNIGTTYLVKGKISEAKSYYNSVRDICSDSSASSPASTSSPDDEICINILSGIERNLRIAEERRVKK